MLSVNTGKTIEQVPAHLPPLGAHAGADEGEFRCRRAGAARGHLPTVGEGLKLFSHIGDAVGDHGVTVVEMDASLAERVRQVCQRDVGMGGQMFGQPTGRRDQRFLAARRDRQNGTASAAEAARPGAASGAGGSASTAWALVPPKPKEFTPTTRRS